MAEEARRSSMSLIPYVPAESREVVLRHGSAVVVYDQQSRNLSLRDASMSAQHNTVEYADCPYCHRPLRDDSAGNERETSSTSGGGEAQVMNPGYFRMLHHSTPTSGSTSRSASPHRRLTQPPTSDIQRSVQPPPGAEFVGSAPASPPSPHGISSSAFSEGYFKRFFIEEGELGRGGKGVVLLVRHVLDGVSLGHFACKRVPVGDDHEWLEKVLVEVQLLQNLSHQNLVSYRHVWLEDYQITTFGPSVPCAFILQQYCDSGDLHHYILDSTRMNTTTQELKERMRRRSKGQLDPPTDLMAPRRMHFQEIFSFFKDITSGLNHLHSNGYIHRDLKPNNCLLHRTGNKLKVLVSDFGEVQGANIARKATGATGTISYCAPEVIRPEAPDGPLGNFTTKSDIFSLGMTVYFMCFARLPYSCADDINNDTEDVDLLREEIAAWAGFDDREKVRTDLPDKLYKFLKRLLSINPNERPGTEEILQGIGAGAGLEENGSFSQPNFTDEIRDRIRPVDSPSPAPSKHHGRQKSGATVFARPGPTNLRPPSPEKHRSPSSPTRPRAARADSESPESSVVLRARKSLAETLSSRPASPPQQLMLPPPPPTTELRLSGILSNPMALKLTKITLFLLKYLSLSSPCSPMAANAAIAYPLLFIAVLDFSSLGSQFISRSSVRVSSVLLGIHILGVVLSLRLNALCPPKVVYSMGEGFGA